jgi:hypothetical protein
MELAQIESKERGSRRKVTRAPSSLPPGQSAASRDRLLNEIAGLGSADAAASWARNGITAKNSLTATDAKSVEEAFALRLSELAQSDPTGIPPVPEDTATQTTAGKETVPATAENDVPRNIDKSVLTIAEPRRHRNKEHLRFVAQQACLVCGRKHSDPHHLGFAQPRALGRKVSDEFVVPLCRIHHRAVHRVSDERAWWKQAGIEPVQIARQLWSNTRLDHDSLHPSLTKEPAEPGAGSRPGSPAGKTSA